FVRRGASKDAVATARPDIVDRNGMILATDVRAPSLFAEPRKIIDVDESVELLTAVLPDPDATEARDRIGSRKGFVWLKREITPKQRGEIYKLGLPAIAPPRLSDSGLAVLHHVWRRRLPERQVHRGRRGRVRHGRGRQDQ